MKNHLNIGDIFPMNKDCSIKCLLCYKKEFTVFNTANQDITLICSFCDSMYEIKGKEIKISSLPRRCPDKKPKKSDIMANGGRITYRNYDDLALTYRVVKKSQIRDNKGRVCTNFIGTSSAEEEHIEAELILNENECQVSNSYDTDLVDN